MTTDLKKLRKMARESVRRGVEYADWEAECVPHLSYRIGDPPDRSDQIFAANLCMMIWRDACDEEGLAI